MDVPVPEYVLFRARISTGFLGYTHIVNGETGCLDSVLTARLSEMIGFRIRSRNKKLDGRLLVPERVGFVQGEVAMTIVDLCCCASKGTRPILSRPS